MPYDTRAAGEAAVHPSLGPETGLAKGNSLFAILSDGRSTPLEGRDIVPPANSSPTCPHCEADPETLERWIQECPATAVKRIRVFGGAAPHISVLISSPRAVLAFAHGL